MDAKRPITMNEIQSRLVRVVGVLQGLCLADLTASDVVAGYFDLNLEQLASRDYMHTQQVSARMVLRMVLNQERHEKAN